MPVSVGARVHVDQRLDTHTDPGVENLVCQARADSALTRGAFVDAVLFYEHAADIARAKAWGALGMGCASREIGERAQKAPGFFGALAAVSQGRLVPAAGGVLILDNDRKVIGAVGISGDTSDRDEDCALSGIRAAGLQS